MLPALLVLLDQLLLWVRLLHNYRPIDARDRLSIHPSHENVESVVVRGRASDSHIRGPGFDSCAVILKLWAIIVHSTLLQFTQLYK